MNSKELYKFRAHKISSITRRDIAETARVVWYAFNGHNVIANIKGNECSMSSLLSNGKYDIVCVVKLASLKVPVSFKVEVRHFSYKLKDFALLVRVDNKVSQKLEVPYDVEQSIKAFMIDYGFKALANAAKSELSHHDSLILRGER